MSPPICAKQDVRGEVRAENPPPVFGQSARARWSYSAYSLRPRQSGRCCYYELSAVSFHISHHHVPADRGAVTYHTPSGGKVVTWTRLIQSTLKKLISSILFNLAFGRRLWKFLQRRWHQLLSQLLCKSAGLRLLRIWLGCVKCVCVCVCVQVDIVNRSLWNQTQFT